jgi:hypothetical protein
MPLSQSPGNLGAPTNGISDTITRNTHQDTHSQAFVGPLPKFGQWDVTRLGTQSNYPQSSSAWSSWFEQGDMLNWAAGKPQMFLANPDPAGLTHLTALSQNEGTAGAVFPGVTWMKQFIGNYTHPHNTATGKSAQPYANS